MILVLSRGKEFRWRLFLIFSIIPSPVAYSFLILAECAIAMQHEAQPCDARLVWFGIAPQAVCSALQIGDSVRFSRAFLQSMAMVSGPDAPTSSGSFARGTVTAIAPITPNSPMAVATVSWADGVTTQVNVSNLEVQPGNPPLTPR